jgi:anthranilate synthase component 1
VRASRIEPSPREFARLARRHNLIPLVREVLGDLETPVSAFRKLRGDAESFLLESVEGGETWGRYSLLGAQPAGRFTARGDRVTIRWQGRTRTLRTKDPLAALAAWLQGFQPAQTPGLPRFFGGAVGYIGYDTVRTMERIPDRHAKHAAVPEIDLLLVCDLVVFDNLSHTMKVVACATVDGEPAQAYAGAQQRIEAILARLRAPAPAAAAGAKTRRPAELRSDVRPTAFKAAVEKARQHIRAGDIFQVVLSHELSCPLRADPLDVYRALRRINPSPYMYFLDLGQRQVIGASPEVLVRVEGRRVEVRPIAGTRPRGHSDAQDAQHIAGLIADEKERAEHVMLVDLGRNDLGRVCAFGTVHCDELMKVERYSHVIHLVSHVSGELREGLDCFDALRACFPAGTVSGAPKIRAMEIIDELESRRRGIYAGAVGYFSFSGAMDTCIAIRTIVCEEQEARTGVGAGIVLDSLPERELTETLEKAEAARAAIALAEEGLDL